MFSTTWGGHDILNIHNTSVIMFSINLESIIFMRFIDLTGRTFGDLYVQSRAENIGNKVAWNVKCTKTGRTGKVKAHSLLNGNTRTSRNFKKLGPEHFETLQQYLHQFNWSETQSGYKNSRLIPKGKKEYRHNVVWRWHHGEIPDGYLVDHIDRNKDNDDIKNLRLVTPLQNNLNRVINIKSTSPFRSVSWDKGKNKWVLDIRITTMSIRYQKFYDSEIEAAKEYNNYMQNLAPIELREEHDLPGNVAGRFIPLLNKI
jgi:hypothetical protein